MLAGPSEILIIADDGADPKYLAADLLSQAERDPLASAILVTDSELLGNAVAAEIEMQLAALPRQEIAALSLANHGKIIIASDMETVIEMANISAPEHLEVMTKEPFALLPYLRNAGAIFWALIHRSLWAIITQDRTTFCLPAALPVSTQF